MQVTPIKTHKITKDDTDLLAVLDRYLPELSENSVVAVTSKIVAICEGSLVPIEDTDKDELVANEADLYLDPEENQYGFAITVKDNIFIASAGVDESNANGYYILWPKDPQKSANMIREHLVEKHSLHNVGVIITDSRITPLRRGVTGVSISHSGFEALRNYIDQPDIFGRPLQVTRVNVMDGLAGAVVFVMGEGIEQTPLAVITDAPGVVFQDRNPSREELDVLQIGLDEDVYAPILKRVPWKTRKK